MQATSARRTMSSEAAHDRPCSSAWLAERPTKQLQWCGRSAMLRAHRRPSEPSPPVTRASARWCRMCIPGARIGRSCEWHPGTQAVRKARIRRQLAVRASSALTHSMSPSASTCHVHGALHAPAKGSARMHCDL
eukprot:scaffold117_cov257-Prasinococcus_capsulatus_cf.AAC.1